MRVLFRSGFDVFSGFGNDAVDLARYMEREGLDVTPWPTSVMGGLPREFTALLEKNPVGRKDVVFTFGPPFDLDPSEYAHLADRAVAYTMWETSRFERHILGDHGWPEEHASGDVFTGPHNTTGRRHGLDLLLVTCEMNVDAFRVVDKSVPIRVLPCGIDADLWEARRRDPARPLTFGMIGMLNGRKDPFLLIQAWRELKDEHPEFDAQLELKTSCPGLHPGVMDWCPDTVIHDVIWPREKVAEWYYDIDVLISVSRGEGNNKPAMEFMASGGTVIASDWSGHQNWLFPEATYPLRGTLMPVTPGSANLDFRADKGHLKELLLHCWKERSEVSRKGEVAASMVRSVFAWPVIVRRLARHFEEVVYGA